MKTIILTHGDPLLEGHLNAQLALDVAAPVAPLEHRAAPEVLGRGGQVAL